MKSVFPSVESRLSSSVRSWLLACGAGAALMLAGASQAATLTGVNTFASADGRASVLFNFDFGAPVDLASFRAWVNFDNSVLSLDALNPGEITLGTLDDSDETSVAVNADEGELLALFFQVAAPASVSSQLQVKLNFLSTLALGQTSDVTFDFDYVDAADPELNSVVLPTASATVAGAVPEPESLALLLAGAGVVAAWGRRRAAGAVHA